MGHAQGTYSVREIPRYSAAMTGNPGIMAALSASAENEFARPARQRAWLQKNGID